MSKQWEEPGSGSGSNAPGCVSTDSLSIFKWPVITIGEQIEMDFRWRFIGWKQTWAGFFWPSPFITHHLLHAYTEINNNKKNLKSTVTAILQINRADKKIPVHHYLIDILAELTRRAMNPGYNLWDKYFIANICLCILCQCVLQFLQMNVK